MSESHKYAFEEAQALAAALEKWELSASHMVHLHKITPNLYIGKGKAQQIKEAVALLAEKTGQKIMEALGDDAPTGTGKGRHHFATRSIHIVVFINAALSATQQRNLEDAMRYEGTQMPHGIPAVQVSVWDRHALILEVFAERAHSREAKVQVDLARLSYLRSRLVRLPFGSGGFGFDEGGAGQLHIVSARGRSTAGPGFISGAGETQLEIERRRLVELETKLKAELEDVRRTRAVQRSSRVVPRIAVVGYTNAGKSALVRAVTKAQDIVVKDQLFATLDPTIRAAMLPAGRRVVLSDTIGFISNLPPQLVPSFRATLEEVQHADLILHVRDLTNPLWLEHKQTVLQILAELGLSSEDMQKRLIEVWNKTDKVEPSILHQLVQLHAYGLRVVTVSALTGDGMDKLRDLIEWQLLNIKPPYEPRVIKYTR